jgi:hypothetical protein
MALAHGWVHVKHQTGEVALLQNPKILSHCSLSTGILPALQALLFMYFMTRSFSWSFFSIAQEAQSALKQVQILNESMNASCNSKKSAGISQFTFCLARNDGPAQQVVARADGIHAEADHVDSMATESENCIHVQLKTPSSGDLAKNNIDVTNIPCCIEIATYTE